MTRGILSACHVRTTRAVTQAELDELYADAYDDEPFVTVVKDPPATKHTLGSNEARVWCRLDERTGRVLAIGVLDNLVKGAAGQAIQAFNVVHGLPETTGAPPAAARPLTRSLPMSLATDPLPRADRSSRRSRPTGRAVEAQAARPGSSPRATTAGIKASGRPDFVLVAATGRPGPGGRRLHAQPVRGGPGPAVAGNLRATRRHGRDLRLRAGRSSRPRARRTRRPARPATRTRRRSARRSRRRSTAGPARSSTSRPGSSARGCPLDLVTAAIERVADGGLAAPTTRARGGRRGAAHHRLDRRRPRRRRVERPAARRRDASDHRHAASPRASA